MVSERQFQITPSVRVRPSPYYDATVAAGVQGFTPYNHMLLPTFYRGREEDYWPIMNGVSMWDVAVERQVELRGPDAASLVALMTPRDLSKTKVGQCKYVPLCDDSGGLINDPVLLKLDEDHFWLSIADSDVLLWAKGLAQGMGFDVQITEPDVSPLAIQGPKAEDVAAALLGEWVRELKFFWFRSFDLDGIPLIVARSGWSKQGGFELYLRDGSQGTSLWDRVSAAGAPFDIQPGTPSTIERIETGLLSYGADMDLSINPFEAGLGKYCALDQDGDFVGKKALQEIERNGWSRQLTGLVVDGDAWDPNVSRWPVSAAGESVGFVTSSIYSPRGQTNVAIAMVDLTHHSPGTALTVHAPGADHSAVTKDWPLV